MPDIFHDFPIRADRAAVFEAITTPRGLDEWWTTAYLRILLRYLEYGERVPYEKRLDA